MARGIGTGIIATSVLLYCKSFCLKLVREIVPKEMFNSISILFGFAIGIGHELVYLINLLYENYKDSTPILIFTFFVPGIISLSQLIMSRYYFYNEVPRYSYEHQEEDICLEELKRIYPDSTRCLAEHKRIKEITRKSRHQYPSYRELFSNKHCSSTIKGIIAICLRSFVGGYTMSMFASMIYENDTRQVNANAITDTVNTVFSIVPVFYITCINIYILDTGLIHPYFIGTVGVLLLYIIRITMKFIADIDNFYLSHTLTGIQFLFLSNSIYILPFVYSAIIMVERGYTVMMMFYWITCAILNGSFTMFVFTKKYELDSVYLGYMIAFSLFCVLVYF